MSDLPDYYAGGADIVLRPEWAAKEATDKNFIGSAANQSYPNGVTVEYAVPAGKTLYITQFSFRILAYAQANGDLNQMGEGLVYDVTDDVSIWLQGGNGGGAVSFSKPLVIPGGHTVQFTTYTFANHACYVSVTAGGYEV